MKYRHTPIFVEEVLKQIPFQDDIILVDCNLGEGGHSKEIAAKLQKKKRVRLIGIERDLRIMSRARENLAEFSDFITLVNDNFINLKSILETHNVKETDAILFDLGISMFHYFDDCRGFSFMKDEPLDMRLDDNCSLSAKDVLNTFSEKEISEILKYYGEERNSKQIARNIIRYRTKKSIETTYELVEIVKSSVPRKFWPKKVSPATKTFQALRIYVNSELDNLKKVLPVATDCLKKGGKIIVITFHSLEDRIVKHYFMEMARGCICPPEVPICVCNNKPVLKIITKNAINPSEEEIKNNSSARSAKLRIAEKI